MIMFKVTKNQGLNLSLEDTIFRKTTLGGGVKLTPPGRFRVKSLIILPSNSNDKFKTRSYSSS